MRLSLLIFLCLIMSSCAIGPQGFYYQPSTLEKNVEFEGLWCHGAAGPSGLLKVQLEDSVTLETRLDVSRQGGMSLGLSLDLAPGATAQFLSNEIKVSSPATDEKWIVTVDQIHLSSFGSTAFLPVDETVDYEQHSLTTTDYIPEVLVQASFSVDNFYPGSVSLILPQIIANDKAYDIPPIRLTVDEKVKEKNYKKGKEHLWWWSYKIDGKSNDNLWAETHVYRIKGAIVAGYLNEEFGGGIAVYFPPAEKWRFATNTIRIIDVDTKQEVTTNFDSVWLENGYDTAFTAPFFTRRNNNTKARILPVNPLIISQKEVDSLIVELPEILINGKKVRVKPITFKKEVGFGVIPFNC